MTPKRYIIPVFVPHLGCPNDCVFCNQRRISGQLTPQTRESVEEIIKKAAEKIPDGVDVEIAYFGGSFTAIPAQEQESLLSAAQCFPKKSCKVSLRVSTRPDCIDDVILRRLKRYGVETVELGVQSMCDDVLFLSGRGHTSHDALKAAKLIKSAGFQLILQMMTGLPGDTFDKSVETAEIISALRPDGVRIYPTVVIRDTKLYDLWKCGQYQEHTVSDAVELCAALTEIFEREGVPVIRLGLNPTEELSSGAAVAGAYHPAFGELVYDRIYLDRARELLRAMPLTENIVIHVPKGKTSVMIGQGRRNVETLHAEFGLKSIKVREVEGTKELIIIKTVEKT